MKKLLTITLLTLAAISPISSVHATAPLPSEATNISEAKPFIPVEELTTPSGIPIWFVQDSSVPVLSIKFYFEHVGSAYETADKQGLARLVSNTLDEGAGKLDATAFQKQLSDYSIALNYQSSRDHFSGNLKTLTRYQDKAFELLKLSLTEPRFDEEAIERMRLANISRIRSSMSRPNWMAARLFNDSLFTGHPYAQNSGGTITSLNELTRVDLVNYVENSLTRSRLKIAVTGDIGREDLIKAVDEVFKDLPETAGAKDQTLAKFEWPKEAKTVLFPVNDLPQSNVIMALPSVPLGDDRYYTARLMSTILGGSGFGSRLMEEIREKHGLTYGIYSQLAGYQAAEYLQIESNSQNETIAELISRSMDELRKLRDMPVTQEELDAHRDYLIGSMPLSLTSTDRISGIMQYLQMNELPSNYLDQRAAALKAVSIEDIQTLANELLDTDKIITVIAGGVALNELESSETQLPAFEIIKTLPNVE